MKKRAEDGRVAVRNVRRHIRQELEHQAKDGEISDDELGRIEKELEKLTHEVVAEIDTMVGPQGKRAARGVIARLRAGCSGRHARRAGEPLAWPGPVGG